LLPRPAGVGLPAFGRINFRDADFYLPPVRCEQRERIPVRYADDETFNGFCYRCTACQHE
jgi:hypothetical protein